MSKAHEPRPLELIGTDVLVAELLSRCDVGVVILERHSMGDASRMVRETFSTGTTDTVGYLAHVAEDGIGRSQREEDDH